MATPTEIALAALWETILETKDIGLDDDFFVLGGDSLSAIQLVFAVQEIFDIDIPLEVVFRDANTIKRMALQFEPARKKPRRDRDLDLPLVSIIGSSNRIPRKKPNGRSPAEGREFIKTRDLFVRDKESGVRRLKPGAKHGAVEINSRGHRSPEIELPKPAQTFRLAFFGTSLTFGTWSGGNDETWPFHTIETLRKSDRNHSYDYLNAGVPGNGIRHMTVEFRDHVAAMEPDIVVITASDLNDDTVYLARKKIGYTGVHYVPSKLSQKFVTIEVIEKNIVIFKRQISAFHDKGKLTFDPKELSDGFALRLENFVLDCRSKTPLVVLMTIQGLLRRSQPKWLQVWHAGSNLFYMPYMSVPGLLDARGEFNRVIRDVASRTNSVLVEMEDVLPATRKYYADSNHFTALGNQIVGEHVARILNESQQFQQLLQEKQRSLASAG